MQTLQLADESASQSFGKRLARLCQGRWLITFSGPLGAGKTTIIRAFLREKGITGAIKSPSFAIVEPYQLDNEQFYHFDFYRINNPEELEYIGIRDYLTQDSIALIEWPEKAGSYLPPADLNIMLTPNATQRTLTITAATAKGKNLLSRKNKALWEDI